MTDGDFRGFVLKSLYDNRRSGTLSIHSSLLPIQTTDQEVWRIFEQLKQHGLVEGQILENYTNVGGPIDAVMGKITAAGVDVVEGKQFQPLQINFVQINNINVTGSSNVAIGHNNSQQILTNSLNEILMFIEQCTNTDAQKLEAKNKLEEFLANRSVAAIFGTTASAILGTIFPKLGR